MSMNLSSNIRQTARRFVATGSGIDIGGNLRSTAGLAGGARYCHTFINPPSKQGLTFTENVVGRLHRIPKIRYVIVSLWGIMWYFDEDTMRMAETAKCKTCMEKEFKQSQRKRLEQTE